MLDPAKALLTLRRGCLPAALGLAALMLLTGGCAQKKPLLRHCKRLAVDRACYGYRPTTWRQLRPECLSALPSALPTQPDWPAEPVPVPEPAPTSDFGPPPVPSAPPSEPELPPQPRLPEAEAEPDLSLPPTPSLGSKRTQQPSASSLDFDALLHEMRAEAERRGNQS